MVADGVADEASGWADVYEIQRVVPPQIPVADIGQAIDLLATREASKIVLRY